MENVDIIQIWVTDDLAIAGNPKHLRNWYEQLKEKGKEYGYKINKNKSYLLARDMGRIQPLMEGVERGDYQLVEGTKYLGAPLGTQSYKDEAMKKKAENIIEKTKRIKRIARTSPHTAYNMYNTHVNMR